MIKTVTTQYNKRGDIIVAYLLEYSDGKIWCVPKNESNTDYQAIQKWIAEGGVVIDNGGNN